MVAKLSSVKIMTAASLETSVPVMPMATPMSAALRAGASLTPSPVMATTLPLCLSSRTMPQLVLGGDPGHDPDLGQLAEQLVVGHGRELGPGDGPARMPSSPAMAAAVVAWSPVIIRTRMPASRHSAMAALASERGGSTIPAIASRVRSVTRPSRSPPGSKVGRVQVALGHHHHPLAPLGHAVVGLGGQGAVLVGDRDQGPIGVPVGPAAGDQHIGGALDIAAHHRLAARRRSSGGRWP